MNNLKIEIEKEFDRINSKKNFIPGKTKIPLIEPTFGHEEILEALDSMLTTNVTMGKKVRRFEKIGTYIAIFIMAERCSGGLVGFGEAERRGLSRTVQ